MRSLLGDLSAAWHSLTRAPRYSLLTVGCLALGLGANATMFGVADALFFRAPALVRDPGRLVRPYFSYTTSNGQGKITTEVMAYLVFSDLRDGTTSFQGVAAYYVTIVSEGRGAAAARLRAALVTAEYFTLLGVRPAKGRLLGASDAKIGGPTVTVISNALWRSRFGGDPAALGKSLRITDHEYVIVGVAPRGFTGVDLEPADLWIPMEVSANELIRPAYLTNRGGLAISLFGRLKPGIARSVAEADATLAFRNSWRKLPGAASSDHVILSGLQRELGPNQSDQAKVSLWLAGVSIVVLLIAAVNCANLMLLRVMRRRRELAIRVALGATRTRVLQFLLAENALLAVGSALVAVGVALIGSRILRGLLLSEDAPVNFVSLPRLFLFALLIASGASLLASLLPITAVRPEEDAGSLRVGAPAAAATKSSLRNALLIGQIALTLSLLVGAGLFTKSLRNVRSADLGFDRDGLLAVNIDFAGVAARPSAVPRDNEFYDGLVALVGAVPGVTSVAVTSSVPFQYLAGSPLSIPGRDKATLPEQGAFSIIASEAYQRTIGLRLLAGRWFVPADYESGGESAVVVNETLAKGFWPGEQAVGQCLVVGTGVGSQPCRTVVGVVADTRRSAFREKNRTQVYLSNIDSPTIRSRMPRTLVVRTARPRAVAASVRRAVQSADPALPFVTVRPLEELVAPKLRPWTLGATVFSLFGALALALAALGLYGTMSYAVSERTHELGVRIALGARSGDILRLVLRHGALIALSGVVLGLLAALLGGPRVAPLLVGVSARDAGVFAIAVATLALAAIAACFGPVRRATRVDPLAVLKAE